MRKLIAAVMAALTLLVVLTAETAPAAQASTPCITGASATMTTWSGEALVWKRYTAGRGMACSSVRYVVNHWLRPYARRTDRIRTNFYDGWVTWRCQNITRLRWECVEPEGDYFKFTAYKRGVTGAGRCDPNYRGACLSPTASDYDCAGGSGDGPYYTGPVEVVGDDHYGLDRDGDGVGCDE